MPYQLKRITEAAEFASKQKELEQRKQLDFERAEAVKGLVERELRSARRKLLAAAGRGEHYAHLFSVEGGDSENAPFEAIDQVASLLKGEFPDASCETRWTATRHDSDGVPHGSGITLAARW